MSLALVSGCTGQQAPDSYTDGVQKNFVEGCTTVSGDTLGSASDTKQSCTCAYNAIKKNVQFATFKEINDDLTESGGGPLPKSFQDAYDSCEEPQG